MTKPLRSRAQAATLALLRTASLLNRHLAHRVEASGVTLQQYNVLRILRGAGADGLATLAIRERMIEEAPGITRLLDRLEKAGLVTRERGGTDRRQVRCRATAKALRLLAELDEPVDRDDRDALAALDEKEQASLLRLLDRIRAGLRERDAAPEER